MNLALRKAVSLLSILLFATIGILSAQPSFSSNPVTTATVGVPYTYGVSATDPSNNTLNFSAITKPSWLTLNNNGQSSATQFGGTVASPGGIAGDDAGNIYVTTLNSTSIYKITPDGTTTLWFTRQSGSVYGMYVYNNHLYVSYYTNFTGRSKITKINLSNVAAGEVDVLVHPTSSGIYLSMTVHNGFMYIAAYGQSKVIKLNLATNAVSDVVTGISGPFGVGVNSAGLLYIASYGSSSIYTFNLTTGVLTQVITGIINPSDVKIDAYDNVYISGRFYVRKYTPNLSSFITAYTASGFVWGMSITPTGALVFGDNSANRVAKLQTGASLTGTPTLADLGVNNVTLRVNNGTTTTDQNFTITVYSAPTIASIPNVSRPLNQGPVTITNPTSNSNGAFTYTSSNPAVASVSGNTITLNTQGTTTITATQAASGYYNAGTTTFTVTVTAPATAGPAGINNGIKMWLDASDIDGDGNAGNDPSNNASLNIWKDRSGLGNHATTVAGKSNINYVTNEINGKPVARFTKINQVDGSILEVDGVDIRAVSNPNVTIFTVYKSGAHPAAPGQGHALWGNDNGSWDRFFYNSWNYTDNGIVSLGPTGANFANVAGSGTVGAVRLMTASYNHNVTNGSAIYFNGAVVTTFTDNTDPSNAFSKLSIGRDGDDGTYNGDIAEMIVYNRKLTDCEILTINQYLGTKYGVTFTSATIAAGGPTTICAGTSVNLTASAGSSYQWFKDNVQIPGATAATYSATTAGSYTVNITSAAGCTATSLPTIVSVNALPTATVATTDLTCVGTNNGTITITANGGTAPYEYSINGGASFVSTNSFAGLAVGNYNIVVKSASGCVSVGQNSTIAVAPDVTAPVANVATLADITAQCGITVTTIPTATDNCSSTINATTTSPLTYNAQGTYTITWTYTDAAGNATTQTQNVTILDNTAPMPNVATLADITAQCGVTVTTVPTATDNCSGAVTATTADPLTYSAQGTYTITWSYTDAVGNVSTQTQKVIVLDNIAPVADLSTLPDITAQCGVTVTTVPTATDNCSGVVNATTTSPLTYSAQGIYTITWNFTDAAGNSSTQTQKVIVLDNIAPVADLSTLPDITGQCGVTVTTVPTATDNCSSVVNATTTSPLTYNAQGTYTITWKYTDAAGNVSTQTQKVIILDNTAPVPNVATLPDITGQCAVTVTTVPTATDNCSGIRTATTTSPLNYNNQGTYTITWRYTDAAGNVSTQTQKVIVKDDIPPVVSCPAPITVVNTAGQCGAVVNYPQPVVSDNCAAGNTGVHTLAQGAQFYDFSQSRLESASSPGLPMSFFPTDGQKMAVFLVNCGASHYMYQDITLPSTGPIQLGFDMKYTNHYASGFSVNQFIAVEIRNPTTNAILQTLFKTNPGAPQSTPMTHYTFDLSAYAGQTVRLEVIDATINNFFLDVLLDNVTIPGSTLQNGSFETGDYTGWQIGSAAGSSCGIFGIGSGPSVTVVQTAGLASGSLFPIGTTTNTFEVTDLVGNKTTCSFDVTVNAPEIKLSGNNTEIVRGDVTPATDDNTDFGGTTPGVTISKTFEIANTGTSALTISSINISNANFVRSGITLPMTINPGQSTTFSINFNTLTLGVQNATVTINNNDCNETAYTFAIKAEITCTNPVFSNVNLYIQSNTTTNSCNAVVTYPLAVSGIPAPAVTYTFSGATNGIGIGTGSGQTFNTGITRVVVSATNACTTTTTEFDVTVVDNVKPVVVTKNMTAYLNAAGQVTINPSDINNGSTDNCGAVTLSLQNTGTICATAAEGSSLTLTAPAGTVITAINFASYGTPNGSCGNFTIGSCHASNSKAIVEALALNQNSVTISATNGVFGDPCGGTVKRLYVTATYSGGSTPINTFDCSKLGENTVTLIVTDANGNSNTGTAVVTVRDNIAPTVVTRNINVNLGTNGFVNITPAQINNGSTDNCSITSYSLDKTSFSCSNVGANTVTLKAIDASGNESTATAIVTVVDITPPTVNTKNITVQLDENGIAAITASEINNNSTDNCSIASYSLDKITFSCSDIGANTVILTVTDVNGRSASRSAIVTVEDKRAPIAVAQDLTVQLDANGTAVITPAQINNNSIDNCSIASYSLDKTNFSCNNVGANTVILTVTDVNGNVSTATAVVTVQDNIAPTAIAQNITVQLDANGSVSITSTQINNGSFDNCSIASYSLDKTNFSCNNVGTNTVVLTVTDVNGNVSTATAVVTVQDNIAPTAIAQNITVQLAANGAVSITPAQINNESSDNCSIASYSLDKTSFDCSNVGENNVILTVTDVNGNVSTATAVVTIQDNIAPTAKTQNVTVQLDANGTVSITPAQINNGSFDNCSIASYSLDKTSFNCTNVGANTVVLTVVDVNGNVSTATAVVTVQDNIAPTITAPATINQGTDAGVCGATVNLGTPVTADNCSVANVTNNAPTLFPVGTTTVTWTVTDANGNTATATQTVVITDTEKPTITAPGAIGVVNDAGLCTAVVNLGTPVTGDNCGVASVTNNAPAVFPVGTTIVTWSVTDIHGNVTDTATQNVTVIDNQRPTISATNINVNNDAAKCGASIAIAQPITADNCGVATVMGVRSDNQLLTADYPVGTTTITWTVRDIHGNINSTIQTIVVTDNEKPVIACAANQVFCANTGGNTQYTIPVLSQSDNCGIASTTYTVTGATNRTGTGTNASGSFAIGTSTVTFTVTDIHGNVSTCSFTVTINPLPVASIAAANADALCNQFVLTGNSTLSGPFTYQWLYNSTTKASTQQLSLGLTDADGIYSLYTTDVNGCRSELAATYNYQKQNLISSYTILATKEVKLGQYNKVETGSVGVTSSRGEAEFKKYSSVTGAGAFVKARDIDTDKGVTIANKIYAAATVTLPTMQYNTTSTRYLQNVTVNSNTTTTLSGNYNDVTLKKGSNVTLNGTIFGRIKLEEGANVRFTSSTINLEELQIEKGPKSGGYSYIRFAPNTSVRVSKKVTIGSDVIVNPEQYQVTFYMADNRRDEEKFHVKGDDTRITANIFLPDGKLKVTGGNYGGDDDDRNKCDHRAHSSKDCKHKGHGHHDCDHKGHGDRDCRDEVYMTGLFIAEEVESEGKHVIWNNYSCSTPPSPVTIATSNTSTTTITEETAKFPATAVTATTEAELKVTVMPNPSRTYFTLKIESKYEAPVTLRVVDATGRVVDSRTKIGANSTIQIGHSYNTGNYFAELIQGNRRKVIQLIKIK